MTKQAQLSLVAFMIAVVIVILALAFAPTLNQISTQVQNSTGFGDVGGLNCSTTTDDFVKAGCHAVDLTQVLFIGGLIALAGVIIAAKIIFG